MSRGFWLGQGLSVRNWCTFVTCKLVLSVKDRGPGRMNWGPIRWIPAYTADKGTLSL